MLHNTYQMRSYAHLVLVSLACVQIASGAPASSSDENEFRDDTHTLHNVASIPSNVHNNHPALSPATSVSPSSATALSVSPKSHLFKKNAKKSIDYYNYRKIVAEGVQHALDECRQKFKWDRWNCPKKAFLSTLHRDETAIHEPLPSNKELAYTRALIASSIVLSMIRSCTLGGANSMCSCTVPTSEEQLVPGDITRNENHFTWSGCDEIVKFGFKVAKTYLNSQDAQQGESSRLVNLHNFETGRQAVKRTLKRKCKCHGASGACQVQTCWPVAPDVSQVGDYLRHQYRVAAKVGGHTTKDTDAASLARELASIGPEKLVFVDASPDYCYDNELMGLNGTLGRYCSRTRHRADGGEVSRSERDSCDRLCTKCGYKVRREEIKLEKQCDCRFVYCCSVECRRCPRTEETYKCVRHS